MQWQDKISNRLFRCPYVHMVFTMPHSLNGLARRNPYEMYQCLMRSAWSSLLECAQDPKHLGAKPGVIMVLHTFGSDLKYHIHAHVLVTFGGINTEGEWLWPKRKKKLIAYRAIRKAYRTHFLDRLEGMYDNLDTTEKFEDVKSDLLKKSWCVHAEPPTMNSERITEYLGKYICRIGLSKKRFKYNSSDKMITLEYKDYRKDKRGSAAPIGVKEMKPLVAIHQIMQHCLPPYFQKCRYLGLHANACKKKYADMIPETIKNNSTTIRTLFQILNAMLGIESQHCTSCGGEDIESYPITADSSWIYTWLHVPDKIRGSPRGQAYGRKRYRSNVLSDDGPASLCPEPRAKGLL